MSAIDIFDLETWDKQVSPGSEDSDEKIEDDPLSSALAATEAAATVDTPFPVRHDLNAKLCLWQGDVTRIKCDLVVNPTNERLTDTTGISEKILAKAGPKLQRLCANKSIASLGTAIVMNSANLNAKSVVHSVAPRYQEKYKNAAENALHKCYRNVLATARERRCTTIAIPPIHKRRKLRDAQYPRNEAAHTAARTIRRSLEKWGDTLDLIAIVPDQTASGNEDLRHLRAVLPLYFPRTAEEAEFAILQLPSNTGNLDGELIRQERTIKIASALGIEAEAQELEKLEEEREKLIQLRAELTAAGKDAEAALATAKAREVTGKIHKLRAVVDAKQALPTKESSKLYASSASNEAKKYTSHLVMTGFAKMRSEPTEPVIDDPLSRNNSQTLNKYAVVREASGTLPRIKEGILQKKGLRSKMWKDRILVLTKEVLAYSHTMRKTGGVIELARVNKVSTFREDAYFGLFIQEPGKVHMFRTLDEEDMKDWERQLQCVTHLQAADKRMANKVLKEGDLEKRGKKSKLWMKRRVYVTGSEFRYSHGFFGDKKASIIPTNYITQIIAGTYKGMHGFELRCRKGHPRIQEVITFRTREPDQIEAWLTALSRATGKPVTEHDGAERLLSGGATADAEAGEVPPTPPFEDRDYGEATL